MISNVVLVPLIVVAGYAAGQLYALAARRGRRGVRSSALRARAALIVAVLLAAAVVAVNPWATPLLLLPAAVAVRLTLPRLSRLIRLLYAEPWGPSDPAVRRAAAEPALVVPAQALLLGVFGAAFTSPWTAAAVSYGLAAAGSGVLLLLARRRQAHLARFRVGTLRRVLVQSKVQGKDTHEDLAERRHPVAA